MNIQNTKTLHFLEIENTGLAMARGNIYKYKSLENKDLINHVIELITTQKIYCPRPSWLNDPKEFKPRFTIGDLTDRAYKTQVEDWVRRCLARNSTLPTEVQIQEFLKKLDRTTLEQYADETSTQYCDEVDDRYRVISFSVSELNLHLWISYAINFQGICFEFHFPPNFATSYKVNYEDSDKTVDLTSNQDLDHLRITGLVKDTIWQPEEEVRLILGDPPIPGGPTITDNKLLIPVEYFQNIYFGYKINPTLKEKLIQLIRTHLPNVGIYEISQTNESKLTRTAI